MSQEWISIVDKLPEQKQPVFYYFGAFDKVYAGFYVSGEEDYMGDGKLYHYDCFYDKGGFLTDDVTYWMPREAIDLNVPPKPSDELRRKCRYWPESFDERDAAKKERLRKLEEFAAKGFKIKTGYKL